MTTNHQRLFTTGLKLSEKGFGLLDDTLTTSKRKGDTEEQMKIRIGLVFDMKGASLTRFIKRHIT